MIKATEGFKKAKLKNNRLDKNLSGYFLGCKGLSV